MKNPFKQQEQQEQKQETRSLTEKLMSILVPNYNTNRVTTPSVKDALSLSAVWRACREIGETTASVPITMIDSEKNEVEEHPLLDILLTAPNGYQTSFTLRETIAIHLALFGNAYLEIVRTVAGEIGSIYLLDPQRMSVALVNNQKVFTYKQTNSGTVVIPPDRVLHIAGMSTDGVIGENPIDTLQRSLSISINTELWVSDFLQHGDPFLGWLETTEDRGEMTEEEHNQLYDSLAKARQDNQYVLVLDGLRYVSRTFSPKDMQLVEQREFIVTEVARIFNIPATKIGDLTRGTYSNVSQENISFVRDTIEPLTKRIDAAFNTLLREEEFRLQHDVEPLLAGEFADKAETWTTIWESNGCTLNEYRAGIGLPEISNGDIFFNEVQEQAVAAETEQVDEALADDTGSAEQ